LESRAPREFQYIFARVSHERKINLDPALKKLGRKLAEIEIEGYDS